MIDVEIIEDLLNESFYLEKTSEVQELIKASLDSIEHVYDDLVEKLKTERHMVEALNESHEEVDKHNDRLELEIKELEEQLEKLEDNG